MSSLYSNPAGTLDVLIGGQTVAQIPSTGLASGFRNMLINCNFSSPINQRGSATRSTTSNAYNFDRWYYGSDSALYQGIEGSSLIAGATYVLSWTGTGVTASKYESTTASSGIVAAAGSFTSVAQGGTFTFTATTNTLWIRFAGTIANLNFPQLEKGAIPTQFEQRPYGLELSLCQRYCYVQQATGANYTFGISTTNSNLPMGIVTFPVQMRSAPTNPTISAANTFLFSSGAPTTVAFNSASPNGGELYGSGGTAATAGYSGRFMAANSSAQIIWSAEL